MQSKGNSTLLEYSHIFSMQDDTMLLNDSLLPDFVGCGLAGEKQPQEVIKTIDLSAGKKRIVRAKEGLKRQQTDVSPFSLMLRPTEMTPKKNQTGFDYPLSTSRQPEGIFNAIENTIGLQRGLTQSTTDSLPCKPASVSKEQIATLESKISVLE
jgi:hypothetical protein